MVMVMVTVTVEDVQVWKGRVMVWSQKDGGLECRVRRPKLCKKPPRPR